MSAMRKTVEGGPLLPYLVITTERLGFDSSLCEGLLTAAGTDMIAFVSNNSSEYKVKDSDKHCKLGEFIVTCVSQATKEAVAKQSRLVPIYQRNILFRLEFWDQRGKNMGDTIISSMAGIKSSILQVFDEVSWSPLPKQEVNSEIS